MAEVRVAWVAASAVYKQVQREAQRPWGREAQGTGRMAVKSHRDRHRTHGRCRTNDIAMAFNSKPGLNQVL